MFFAIYVQVVPGVDVCPDFLHLRPVRDHAVLHRVLDLEQPPVLLHLRPDHPRLNPLQSAAGHHPHVLRFAHKRREYYAGLVPSGKSCFQDATTIIYHHRLQGKWVMS